MAWLIDNAGVLYATAYCLTIAAVALWEALRPRRPSAADLRQRWLRNAALLLIDTALIRTMVPISTVALAVALNKLEWGLIPALEMPGPVAFVAGVLALDITRYALHCAFHRLPLLWRMHAVHHSDPNYDLTTALRFHPTEAFVFTGLALAALIVLGPPAEAVALYEAIYVIGAFVSHANAGFPARLERILRWFYVTPDMHRVHHSANRDEADSNFGNVLPWWDRLFRTYRAAPRQGHASMTIGLALPAERLTLPWLLVQPLLTEAAEPSRT